MKKVAGLVIFCHCICIFLALFNHYKKPTVSNQKMVVHTFQIKPKIVEKPIRSQAPKIKKAASKSKTIREKNAWEEIQKQCKILREETTEIKPAEIMIPKTVDVEEVDEYKDHLIVFFQGNLELPEKGDVKVNLEIDRQGKLVHFEIIDSESTKNEEFLKNRLPELKLPCLNETKRSHAYQITFKGFDFGV
jgi:hypothetical protein